jgi:hypothetical protein
MTRWDPATPFRSSRCSRGSARRRDARCTRARARRSSSLAAAGSSDTTARRIRLPYRNRRSPLFHSNPWARVPPRVGTSSTTQNHIRSSPARPPRTRRRRRTPFDDHCDAARTCSSP